MGGTNRPLLLTHSLDGGSSSPGGVVQLVKRGTAAAGRAAEEDQVLERWQCGSLVSPVFRRKYQRAKEGSGSPRDAPLETATFHLRDRRLGAERSLTFFEGLRDCYFKPKKESDFFLSDLYRLFSTLFSCTFFNALCLKHLIISYFVF